jgi:hypothetical protein
MADEAAKSVIEIDLNDESWKQFQASFNQYQKALGAGKKEMAAVGAAGAKAATQTAGAFEKVKAILGDIGKAARDSVFVFGKMASLALDIAKSFASAAFSAAKWLAFGAIASGFGLGALGSAASGARRNAAGAGVTPGQFKATDIYFGQILKDPTGVLNNFADVKSNPAAQRALSTLGINPNQDPFALFMQAMPKLSDLAQKNQFPNQAVFEGSGLSGLLSLEQFRSLKLKPGEVAGLAREATRAAPGLAPDDATLRAWQRFNIGLDLAGNKIENSLIRALVRLTPSLTDLANTIADVIDRFSKTGAFKEGVEDVRAGIKEFADYLGSGKFKKDIRDFSDALVQAAGTIRKVFNLPKTISSSYDDMNRMTGGWIAGVRDTIMDADVNTDDLKFISVKKALDKRMNLADALRRIDGSSEMTRVDFMGAQGAGNTGTTPGTVGATGKTSTLFSSPTINLNVIAPPWLDFSAAMAQGAGQ